MADDAALIADIARILKDIAWGEPERVADLFRYTGDPVVPSHVAELAERIGTIIVQKEVREFQLETLIEDLFATRKALVRARHDPLTGLPNRAMFEEALDKACAQAVDCGADLALLLVDFDGFKSVNDTLGHDAGDALLTEGAARIAACVGEYGMIGRMGGDEFAVLLVGRTESEVLEVAGAVLESLRRPFPLREAVRISASVGVAFSAPEASTPAALMKTPMSPCTAPRGMGGIRCMSTVLRRWRGTGGVKLFLEEETSRHLPDARVPAGSRAARLPSYGAGYMK